MLDQAVPRKTAQGRRELVDRAHKLHARSRSLLIAVHGDQNVGELKRQFAALGDVGALLDELAALGLIETAAAGAPPPPAAAAAETIPPLQLARSFINETAVAALGLRAFLFTLKLERCYTKDELQGLLPEYQRVLAKAKNEEFAQAMVKRVKGLLAQA